MATSVVLTSAPKAWIESRGTQFGEHKLGSVNCACQCLPCQNSRLSFSATQKKRSFLPLASFSSSSSPSSFSPKTKLYVSGLSFRTTEESLRNAFQNFGQLVEVNPVMDRIANRPRGFAFLRYETEEESQKAIEGMHGRVLLVEHLLRENAIPNVIPTLLTKVACFKFSFNYVSVILILCGVMDGPYLSRLLRLNECLLEEIRLKEHSFRFTEFLDGRVIFVEEAKPRSELRQTPKQLP